MSNVELLLLGLLVTGMMALALRAQSAAAAAVDLAGWRTLAVVRTPRTQFRHSPLAQTEPQLPSTRSRWPGLYVADEITEDSSSNGAVRSGEAAARIVADDLRAHSPSTRSSPAPFPVVGSPKPPQESRA